MVLYHHTRIMMNHPDNIVEFDPEFNDKVWKRICWDLVTMDISNPDVEPPSVAHSYYTDLPPTIDPAEFIPFDQVDERDLLRWIDEAEGPRVMRQRQMDGWGLLTTTFRELRGQVPPNDY